MEVAHRDLPVPADGRTLLHAIPANTTPARQSPVDSESVPELCDGIMVTAERLRQLARAFTGQARWSPAATSLSWRTDAHCSAILCHASDITVRTLTERAGQLGAPAAARRNAMRYGEHRAERPQPEPAAAELDGLPGVGQIEGTLRECHVIDPALLARASAVDNAARELLAEATATSQRRETISAAARPTQPVAPPPRPRH